MAQMDVKRACKYVHLLPTNFRACPNDYRDFFITGVLDI